MTAYIFAISKKIGLSMDEMGQLTTQTFIDIVTAYTADDDSAERVASQSDIDAFFG